MPLNSQPRQINITKKDSHQRLTIMTMVYSSSSYLYDSFYYYYYLTIVLTNYEA